VLEKPRGDASDATGGGGCARPVRLLSRIRVITHPRARLTSGRDRAARLGKPPPCAHGTPPQFCRSRASTGGPGALTELLRALPPASAAGACVRHHIAASEPFAVAFSDLLGGQTCGTRSPGDRHAGAHATSLRARPPDRHLLVAGRPASAQRRPSRHSCRPSSNVLFESWRPSTARARAGVLLYRDMVP